MNNPEVAKESALENRELRMVLAELVDQFHAYENGWLGEDVWRIRIGLPQALKTAEKLLPLKENQQPIKGLFPYL